MRIQGILMLSALLLFGIQGKAQQQRSGKVVSSETGEGLAGATVWIKGSAQRVMADGEGLFAIRLLDTDTLMSSYIGHMTAELTGPFAKGLIVVKLVGKESVLSEVVVNTGYQSLTKASATGSFVKVDQELLSRSVSTSIVDRLRDVVPGLSFNNVGSSKLSIRGQSTIFGNAEPLIVIDNFPYEGNLLDINPNDVESITVLKDAAAAAIWGAKAGNGVIVITSKQGRLGRKVQVSVNSNVSVGAVPNLDVRSRLSSADYIDIEKRLFQEGYYNGTVASGFQPLSPVLELLVKKQNNPAMGGQIDQEIEQLKGTDVRRDIERYFYQPSVFQQHAVNLNGGGQQHSYFISAGYDKNRESLVGNDYSRLTLNARNNLTMLGGRLELVTGVYRASNLTSNSNPGISGISSGTGNNVFPYLRLADADGNPLPVIKSYSEQLLERAEGDGLLDWRYYPLREIAIADNTTRRVNTRVEGSVRYKLSDALTLAVLYQFSETQVDGRNNRSQESYFVREMINRFTQVSNGILIRPVPLGGILDLSSAVSLSHTFRPQVDFKKKVGENHQFSAFAGMEVRDTRSELTSFRYYGYDEQYARNSFVDYARNDYPLYHDNSIRSRITNADDTDQTADIYRSFYFNGNYGFANRIHASLSARVDQSNLFGVRTNQKGVPLWSAGLAWTPSSEPFYRLEFLPYLKVRASYGYNGSVNKSVTAFTTAAFTGVNLYQQPYATITNPPNPELRWERVKIINLGIDFSGKANRLSGSLEFFLKNGIDLIGDAPLAPSTGLSIFRGNTANTIGRGVDLNLAFKNLQGKFSWQTDVLVSAIREKVTTYSVTASASGLSGYIQSPFMLPLTGRPLYSAYSYGWAGLDPQTGDPQGYIAGTVSKDYVGIFNATNTDNMVYSGPRRPTVFGAVRNTFAFGDFSASFSIAYRLGYYFRNTSVGYGNDYGLTANHGDYALRWKNPGDEVFTNVPSIPAVPNANRDVFYTNSSALISRADNIRLQDLRLNYRLQLGAKAKGAGSIDLYAYASNLKLLWKATKFDVDPDNTFSDVPVNVAFGMKLNF